jgi:hypothetical protein
MAVCAFEHRSSLARRESLLDEGVFRVRKGDVTDFAHQGYALAQEELEEAEDFRTIERFHRWVNEDRP